MPSARTLILVLLVPLTMQAYVFYHSTNYGLLVGLLSRDDVYIVHKGLQFLDVLSKAASPAGLIRRIARFRPIHNPLSDLQAAIGLLSTGGNIRAPFTLNFWSLSLTLYIILSLLRRAPNTLLVAIYVLIVTQPLTICSLIFLKADFKGGLLIAAAVLCLYRSRRAEKQSS